MKKFLLLLIVVILFPVHSSGAAEKQPSEKQYTKKIIDGQVIVKFKKAKLDVASIQGKTKVFYDKQRVKPKKLFRKGNSGLYELSKGESVQSAIRRLQQLPEVEAVQPNYQYKLESIQTNDPLRQWLWGLDNNGSVFAGAVVDADMDAPEAWSVFNGSSSVLVAVLDSGVGYNHPDLHDNMWDGTGCLDEFGLPLGGCEHGYDFSNDKNGDGNLKTPLDYDKHGTHVAGTIAAIHDNSYGVAGVASSVRIMAVASDLTTASLVSGINFAKYNGTKIINASIGGQVMKATCAESFDQEVYEAIRDFPGMFVAAAGNNSANHNGVNSFNEPADYGHTTSCWAGLPNVISVAATNYQDNIASFSDYGPFIDVAAPGQQIASLYNQGTTTYSEDFESVIVPALPTGFTKGGTTTNYWQTIAAMSTTSLSTGSGTAPYPGDSDYFIESGVARVSGNVNNKLVFDLFCDTEYINDGWADYLSLEYSTDTIEYFEAERFDEAYLDDDLIEQAGGLLNTGLAFNAPREDFSYRFRWVTNSSDNDYVGCKIDNIKVMADGDGSAEKYIYLSGTSMAAPHVSGLAALIMGYNPWLSVTQVKNLIMTSGDMVGGVVSMVNSGRRINAYNALSIFRPRIGTNEENILLASAITKNPNSGTTTVSFRIKDGFTQATTTLNSFQYSLDGGENWLSPVNGDLSTAFSRQWQSNNYLAGANLAGTAYQFSFDTIHPDFGLEASTTPFRLRFKAFDGATSSEFAISDSILVDNFIEAPVLISPFESLSTSSNKIILIGTAEASSSIKVYNQYEQYVAGQQLGSTSIDFAITVNLADGTTTRLKIIVVDRAGNVSSTTSVPDIYSDWTPPTAVLSGLPGLSTTSQTIDVAVAGSGVTKYKYTTDSNGWSEEYPVNSKINIGGFVVGAHTLKVIGGDIVSNWQATTSATTYSWSVIAVAAPPPANNNQGTSGGNSSTTYTKPTVPTSTPFVSTTTRATSTAQPVKATSTLDRIFYDEKAKTAVATVKTVDEKQKLANMTISLSSTKNKVKTSLGGKFISRVKSRGEKYFFDQQKNKLYTLKNQDEAFFVLSKVVAGASPKDLSNIERSLPPSLLRDSDKDGLNDYFEAILGTNPRKADTDGDGYSDGAELKMNFNPLGKGYLAKIPKELIDDDKDGLPNAIEEAYGLNKAKKDTDSDGFSDYDELKTGFNPNIKNKKESDNRSRALKGRLLFNVKTGQKWYVAANSKAYYIGNKLDFWLLSQDLGVGIDEKSYGLVSAK